MKRKWIIRTVGVTSVPIVIVLTALSFPKPFFMASAKADNLTIYSDRQFSERDVARVLSLAQAKLASSPIYSEGQEHQIFVSNSAWRRVVFLTRNFNAGGINYHPWTTNVFLREADIGANRLIGHSGKPILGSRTLDYFIAHEVTHTLTGQAFGTINHYAQGWKREGYADYVAKGADFEYDAAVRAFVENDDRMDVQRSGLYWRYHLLVSHLLDKCNLTVQQLFLEPIERQAVEQAIRGSWPDHAFTLDMQKQRCASLLHAG